MHQAAAGGQCPHEHVVIQGLAVVLHGQLKTANATDKCLCEACYARELEWKQGIRGRSHLQAVAVLGVDLVQLDYSDEPHHADDLQAVPGMPGIVRFRA